jgi:hypothetical protein
MKKLLSACLVAMIGALTVTAQSQTPSYQFVPGEANDIAVGGDGSVWAVGTNAIEQGGFGVFKKTSSGWQEIDLKSITRYSKPIGAIRIAVDPDGNPWIVTADQYTFRRIKNKWENMNLDPVEDIGIGSSGTVWVIYKGQGYKPYAFVGNKWVNYYFKDLPCDTRQNCSRISVNADGNIFVVDKEQSLYRSTNMPEFFAEVQRGNKEAQPEFTQLPGLFTDVGVGADNSVYAVSATPYRGGGQVFKWSATDWEPLPVGAANIAVDPKGFPWMVNSNSQILTDSSNSAPATLKDALLGINATWFQAKNALTLKDPKFTTQLGGTVGFSLDFMNQTLAPITLQYNLSDQVKLLSNGKTYGISNGQNGKCGAFSENVAPGATLRLQCTAESEGQRCSTSKTRRSKNSWSAFPNWPEFRMPVGR